MLAWFFLWLAATPGPAAGTAYADADTMGEALVMGQMEVRGVEALREFCHEAAPGLVNDLDKITFYWEVHNDAELRALQAAKRDGSEAWKHGNEAPVDPLLAPFRLLPAERKLGICMNHIGQIRQGDRDMARKTPAVSRFLATYLSEHPLSRREVRRREGRTGCMKQTFNTTLKTGDRFDLVVSRKRCDCIADTMDTQFSDAEHDALNEHLAQGRPAIEAPGMQRVAPLLAQCMVQ
ncbi:MAG TPA: hypothetical protein VGE64_00790 [Xanthomonadaceae bacterium]